jgi:hypothetical protein
MLTSDVLRRLMCIVWNGKANGPVLVEKMRPVCKTLSSSSRRVGRRRLLVEIGRKSIVLNKNFVARPATCACSTADIRHQPMCCRRLQMCLTLVINEARTKTLNALSLQRKADEDQDFFPVELFNFLHENVSVMKLRSIELGSLEFHTGHPFQTWLQIISNQAATLRILTFDRVHEWPLKWIFLNLNYLRIDLSELRIFAYCNMGVVKHLCHYFSPVC